ncbi:type IV secretion protein Rhs [Stenotrophomonas maltophilia]|uniref:RHS repeat-associated core domain-containing protein n=1 Tax=unclassified Stenotrophomonas TaxID=196198 RepID=UPI0006AA190C|nr:MULTISPECIES: RHS repeat-associated core domain-containing protein [unclassified Stenotrophomonas]ALA86880.1 type IV secretion protein Rhs [Stenotrophomonas maltophilia]ALA90836.1 type IV secretion protein Rhs [Stenotrophomonas maltophilia]MDV3466520.1 RHS repeat-associated core domain-containing protein [Stenotrophomonas sp. C960]MDV3530173.1 RHS repeat-associated core domain-containing protein [Stenotrophomonas sp. C2866]
MLERLKTISCAVLAIVAVGGFAPAVAQAQESRITWRISQPGGDATQYKTQQAAVAAIKNLPAPSPFPPEFQFGWQYVDKIKSKVVDLNGNTSITYWMGKAQPSDPDWSYIGRDIFPTEEAMVADFLADQQANNPVCPGAAVTPSGDWFAASPDQEGVMESRYYDLTSMAGNNTAESPCTPYTGTVAVARTRRLNCPIPFTQWSNKHNACVSEEFVATITSKSQKCDKDSAGTNCPSEEDSEATNKAPCDGNVGNPCDVKTGEKYEIAQDFDLGWIALTRFYHSGISTSSGGFGYGWTHSLGAHLALDGVDSVGLIESTGFQRAFKKIGQAYEADDDSGDRLVQNGSWTLYSAGSISTFGADGRLAAKRFPDGTSLTYIYDDSDRLAAVTHSSGRTLELVYQSNDYEALISSVLVEGIPLATYTYTPQNQVATVTYAGGGVRTYHYENQAFSQHLTGITAEDGRRYSTFVYDSDGRVISSQHAGGADGVTLAYSPNGGAVVTDALGRQTDYTLTPGGDSAPSRKVTGLTDSQGTVSRTYYDQSVDFRRRLDTYTDRRGIQTKHTYAQGTDPVSGRAVSIHTVTEAVGLPEQRVVTTARDVETNAVLTTRIGSRETRTAFNARRQPTANTVTDTASGQTRITSYTYCEAADVAAAGSCPVEGLLKSVDGPRTDVADAVTYAYYSADDAGCATGGACSYRKGDLRSVTNALGQTVETLAYDAFGRPLSVKDANGVVTDYTYHPRGWPTSITVRGATTAEDRVTQLSYWPTGQVQRITEPDGSSVSYVYDAALRLTGIEDNAGNTIHYTLDNAGNRLKEDTLDAGGTLRRTLARTFNTLGQLTALKDAGNHATGFAYDANGNPQTVTDALQRVTSQQYDPLNRLAQTLQDVGGVAAEIRSQYNALDQVTQVTDPKGLHTTYAYNGFGDLTGQVSPDSGASSFTVDAAGNRKTATDARGVTATYHYDALNRLIGIAYPDPNLDAGYSYDVAPAACAADERFAKGRLGQVLHANGSTQYCHDRFGQVTRKVQTVNGVASTLRYAYSKSGRLTALTYPDGSVADYVRDTQGRISQIGLTRPGQARQIVVNNVTYAAFGPATGWTYGNGRQLQRPLDLDYRPQAVHDSAAGGLSLGYGYDPVGSITELKNGAGSTVLAKYAYDTLGRLTQTQDGTTGTPIETYAYDATGNRTSLTTSAGTASYTYPATSHRLTAVDGEARNHDAVGNTTSIGSKAFTYNDANRMNAVKQGNAVLESYAYNHRGERVLRTPAGGAAQITLYDEAGQWLGNYSATGQAQQQAIWLDNYPVALINVTATGVPELAYVQPDHLGTPRVVIDPVRNVAIWEWSNKSEVFGNQIPSVDPDGDGVAFELALRFPGQQATDASGLFYNYFRDYDPASARYVESDPVGLNAGVSTYGYVISNPARFTDPLGLTTTLITTYDFGIANHSAIHVSIPGKPDFLYDPSGSYAPGGRRGTGGLFEGRDASLASYKKYQVGTGSRVELTVIPLTPEQELTLIANAEEWGDARGFWCASHVSGALDGMCGIKQTLFPGVLQKSAKAAECPVK